jgi:CRP-like cAMP-binding protein
MRTLGNNGPSVSDIDESASEFARLAYEPAAEIDDGAVKGAGRDPRSSRQLDSPPPHRSTNVATASEQQPMSMKRAPSLQPPTVRPPPPGRPKNHLVAALPVKDFRRLLPHLKTVPIHLKQVLHTPGEPLRVVYFLNGGVASLTTLLSDGTMVEATTVGNEGMLGIEAFLSADAVAPGKTLMQVSDTDAEMLSVDDFRREVATRGALHDLMGRYTQVIIAQLMQSTACKARHQVQQRCARWLLMTHDRMQEQDFNLSHEFLAVMLGVVICGDPGRRLDS